jgi:hypothetical protein
VTIRGSGFTGVTSVLFGPAAATRFHVVSGLVIVALGPAEGAGTVHVQVVTSHGTSPAAPASRFTFLPVPRSSLTWAKPVRVAGNGDGYLAAVSCADASRCVAIDTGGDVVTWNGAAWSAPSPGLPWAGNPPSQISLSCPARTWCAATGNSLWAGHGRSWTSYAPGGLRSWSSVSCATAAFCMAATDEGWVSQYNGRAWSAPVDVDTSLEGTFSVSCGAGTR